MFSYCVVLHELGYLRILSWCPTKCKLTRQQSINQQTKLNALHATTILWSVNLYGSYWLSGSVYASWCIQTLAAVQLLKNIIVSPRRRRHSTSGTTGICHILLQERYRVNGDDMIHIMYVAVWRLTLGYLPFSFSWSVKSLCWVLKLVLAEVTRKHVAA